MSSLQFVCFVILLLLPSWLGLILPTADTQAVARPGCQTQCGHVQIPFPFGIQSGCYLHKWYEIICYTTNHTLPKPYLSHVQLEVDNISVETSTLVLKFPTISNCHQSINQQVNLGGSPFFLSSSGNRLTAVGCGSLALMSLKSSAVGGCMSFCDRHTRPGDLRNITCIGISCCQTNIPSHVQVFNATLSYVKNDTIRRKGDNPECTKFAYLVDINWFKSANMSPYAVGNQRHVPVMLDWKVDRESYTLIQNTILMGSHSSYLCKSLNITPKSSTRPMHLVYCSCKLGFQGNPYLEQGCQGKINYAAGTLLGFGLLFPITCLWLLFKASRRWKKRKRKEKFFKRNGGLLLQKQLACGEANVEKMIKMFSSRELEKATDHYNINRLLGQGSQGTVYKGMLGDGRIVAVKKSKLVQDHEGKLKQFINEVVILSQISHRNVVKLLGCCLETQVPLLVYEFIPNGTLFHYLHDRRPVEQQLILTWKARLRIATEVAGALSYLHSAASTPVYHRDIKSTNILLDGECRAKIADFGISRTINIDQTHLTTKVQGTFGYLDPEYYQSSQFTEKSDVYSFGVVLVELLTRKRAVSCSIESGEVRSLVGRFIVEMERNHVLEMIDRELKMEAKTEEILIVAELAKKCLRLTGKERPSMKQVTTALESINKFQLLD
ncbi:Wall-associated receptor kinase-like 9 [Linum perenne]